MSLTLLVVFLLFGVYETEGRMRFQFSQRSSENQKDILENPSYDDNMFGFLRENQSRNVTEVSCNSFPNHIKNTMNTYKSVDCKPRKTVLPIRFNVSLNQQLMHLHPTHVEVSRCSGMCPIDTYVTKSCLPFVKSYIEVPVTAVVMKSPSETNAQCFLVYVEEHSACECDCSVQKRDCHPTKQRYNEKRCRCECTSDSLSMKCGERKVWDPVTCSCECGRELTCSTGYLFHPEHCNCVKIRMKQERRNKNTEKKTASKYQKKIFKRGSSSSWDKQLN